MQIPSACLTFISKSKSTKGDRSRGAKQRLKNRNITDLQPTENSSCFFAVKQNQPRSFQRKTLFTSEKHS